MIAPALELAPRMLLVIGEDEHGQAVQRLQGLAGLSHVTIEVNQCVNVGK